MKVIAMLYSSAIPFERQGDADIVAFAPSPITGKHEHSKYDAIFE